MRDEQIVITSDSIPKEVEEGPRMVYNRTTKDWEMDHTTPEQRAAIKKGNYVFYSLMNGR